MDKKYEEEGEKANKITKIHKMSSSSLRETQIKLDATVYPSDRLQNVKPDNMRCWKGSGEEELAYSTSGSENEYNCFDVKLPISSKAENLHPL